ncbi:MAG: hypothetical protein DWQ40_12695 [Actinobacteria bacterium]|nr:MAG: hypothetical protein DWQ40_12695 [Actinomycetota bacterium]
MREQTTGSELQARLRSSSGVIARISFGLLGLLLGVFLIVLAIYVRVAEEVLADLLEIPDRSTAVSFGFGILGIVVIGTTALAALRPSRATLAVGGGVFLGAAVLTWIVFV